jgi:hypothetical protein
LKRSQHSEGADGVLSAAHDSAVTTSLVRVTFINKIGCTGDILKSAALIDQIYDLA